MINDYICTEKDGDIIRDAKLLMEPFNENYIYIVEIQSDNKPSFVGNCEDSEQDDATVDEIMPKYSAHPRVQKI